MPKKDDANEQVAKIIAAREPKEKEVLIRANFYAKEAMFLRENVGTAQGAPGHDYELSLNLGGMVPMVRSKKSGRWFALPWRSILAAAVEAKIDEEDPK